MKITYGCDPEFFLYDTKLKTYISAHNMVPGTKEKPYPLSMGSVQVDGTAVEFNINPAINDIEFEVNVSQTLREIRDIIPSRYEFSFEPFIVFNEDYWKEVPDTAKELGCSPDFSAYHTTPTPNPSPKPANKLQRTGAGHIHIGWTQDIEPFDASHYWDCRVIARQFHNWYAEVKPIFDKDTKRSLMYGYNSAFRPKSYGLELRQPSNAWIKYPKLWRWMIKSIDKMISDGLENKWVNSKLSTYIYGSYKSRLEAYNAWAKKNDYEPIPTDWSIA